MKLQTAADDFDQFTDCHMIRDQEFGSIQYRQLFLPMKSFDDHRNFVRVQSPDLLNVLLSLG